MEQYNANGLITTPAFKCPLCQQPKQHLFGRNGGGNGGRPPRPVIPSPIRIVAGSPWSRPPSPTEFRNTGKFLVTVMQHGDARPGQVAVIYEHSRMYPGRLIHKNAEDRKRCEWFTTEPTRPIQSTQTLRVTVASFRGRPSGRPPQLEARLGPSERCTRPPPHDASGGSSGQPELARRPRHFGEATPIALSSSLLFMDKCLSSLG